MNYPMNCLYCGEVIDSHDSYADTRAELGQHVKNKHPDTGTFESFSSSIAERSGLEKSTIEDLLRKGWKYQRDIGQPDRWIKGYF